MRLLIAIFLSFASANMATAAAPYVVVLGTAQDAGAPQMGCMSEFCEKAWKDKERRIMVSSMALVDPETKQRWIFDATPDLPPQFQLLKETTGDFSNSLSGIFLTHAHIGHYTGLMYLGRESIGARGVPVYVMPRMRTMLEGNAPWSQLVKLKNISLQSIADKKSIQLTAGISITPFLVPHRDEFSETVGYRIKTASKSLIFIPDIDKWSKWDESLPSLVGSNDYLLLDGTFYADGEIARPMNEVPHPFISETMEILKELDADQKRKVIFTHMNHSNPILQGGEEKIKEMGKRGFSAAQTGQKITL